MQKHGLGQASRVMVFLGDIDEGKPESWGTEFNTVGRVSMLGRELRTKCAKCRTDTALYPEISAWKPGGLCEGEHIFE
ncbi:hypothetical protein QBC35DRAFT_455562 [Podospora australis]|uniref:Tyrosinase C-terminal domain-containing protein n=1 Tax=Podospora australis TaxID=1536484 RepID=A0AAN6WLC5_9PEZI|nr:hypothetical protein QBC35DRAFT_455562 [Podospora australis]